MTAAPHQLFIGYRRDDGGHAGRLYDRLAEAFSANAVFIDREDLTPGQAFRQELAEAIRQARVCVVVIGQHWFSDKNRERLFGENDITRGEIRVALDCVKAGNGYAVIPVLAGGAAMPAEHELPEDIAHLPRDHAHTLEETRYSHSVEALIELLAKRYGLKLARGYGKPFHLIDQTLSEHFADPLNHLGALHDLLQAQGKAAVLAAATVQGMGGVGKTQLALKYSHVYRNEYHGVWWFRAESPALLDQDCAAFCEAMKISVPQGTLHRQALRDWLARQPRWLLAYDNVEDAKQFQAYLPQGGEHHVLITSRLPEWRTDAMLRLDVWNDEQALDFLRSRLPKASDDQRRALAHALGGLPLALEQACAYLAKTGVSVEDYIARIDDFERHSPLLGREDSPVCARSVLATLSLAFDRLSDGARELLQLCAWLAPEPIPEFLFTEHPELLPEALAASSDDSLVWRETIAELTGYALCQASDGYGAGLLFHRLTQAAVLARRWEQKERDTQKALALLHAAFPRDTGHPEQWANVATLAPHVLQFEAWNDKSITLQATRLAWLFDRVAHYLVESRGLYGEAKQVRARALEITRNSVGDEHPDSLALMNNLASTLRAQGDLPAARALQESVLAACCRLLGEDHPSTLSSMNNLAGTLRDQGELPAARALQESVLSALRCLLGEEHPDALTAMNNLAGTLLVQGELPAARALQESVLASLRRLLGEEHPDTITVMGNLAGTLRAQDDLSAARALDESVLAARRRLLGEEHPDTITAMGNLAGTLWAQGDLPTARALEESVLAARHRLLGEEHPDTLTAMGNLAGSLEAQGDLSAARALQESVLAARRRLLGEEHPDTLTAIGNLAGTLWAQGDIPGTRALEESALAALRHLLGEEHPDTLTAMNNLAATLHIQGDLPAARMLLESALIARRRLLGEEHTDTIASAWNLFTITLQLGDKTSAGDLFKTYLLPLMHSDPSTLSSDLRTIRQQLQAAFTPPSSEAS
ncbi:MAG TPA: FxSxx-COOH system tetratricopeptide repeat protein [Rhodocyclaceae bacterium]